MMRDDGIERRQEKRLTADVGVSVLWEGIAHTGRLKDISRGGAAVIIEDAPPAVDGAVSLELGREGSGFHLVLPGGVIAARRLEGSERRYTLHLRFGALEPAQLASLARLIQSVEARPAQPIPDQLQTISEEEVDAVFARLKLQPGRRIAAQPTIGTPRLLPWIAGVSAVVSISTVVLIGRTEKAAEAGPAVEAQMQAEAPAVPTPAAVPQPDPPRIDAERFIQVVVRRPGVSLRRVASEILQNADEWDVLRLANPGAPPPDADLPQGLTITVPRYIEYVVREGDSLSRIAQQYLEWAADYDVLYAWNRSVISNPKRLEVGTVLKVPLLVEWAADWLKWLGGERDTEPGATP
jgi:hypothetical protein